MGQFLSVSGSRLKMTFQLGNLVCILAGFLCLCVPLADGLSLQNLMKEQESLMKQQLELMKNLEELENSNNPTITGRSNRNEDKKSDTDQDGRLEPTEVGDGRLVFNVPLNKQNIQSFQFSLKDLMEAGQK